MISPTASEEMAPSGVTTRSATPMVILRLGSAGNDAVCAEPAIAQDGIASRVQRSYIIGKIIIPTIHAVVAVARRAYARHQQRRQARAIRDVLRHLDDHLLRDVGFHRSEITFVAAEIAGEAEYTRVRALLSSRGLPR